MEIAALFSQSALYTKGFIASRCVGSCSLCTEAVIWGLAKLLHNFNETGANPATPEEAARALLIHTCLNIVTDCTYVAQGKLSTADWNALQYNHTRLKMRLMYWLHLFLFSHINFQPPFASILYNSWTNAIVCDVSGELTSCQDAVCVARSVSTVFPKHLCWTIPSVTSIHFTARNFLSSKHNSVSP